MPLQCVSFHSIHTTHILQSDVYSFTSFSFPPGLESLLLRTGQVIGVIGVDDKSLQRRLFTFTGAKTLSSVQISKLLCVSMKTTRRRLNEFQLQVEKHSCLTDAKLDDEL